MTAEASFVLLFSIATAVAIGVRRTRVPYTVALVVVGLALGSLHVMTVPHLTKDLLFALLLPGLIFEAAFNLDARELWRNRLAVSALAVPGVAVAILLTAAIVSSVLGAIGSTGFDWRAALAFGALIAATDPIAVVALFKRMHVPHRLSVLVEGESLLNDGTSVVFYTMILAFVAGASTTLGGLVLQFGGIVGGGALAGAVVGIAATQVTRRINEPLIEITLTVIAAYGSFVVAEHFHASGVIATVVAGQVCGSYGRRVGMSPTTRIAVEAFWDYAAFALNSIVFLLIGFEVHLGELLASWLPIVIAYAASAAGRLGVVLAVATLLRRTSHRLPAGWGTVLTWGGLRGALSLVLALSLPADFPQRQELITLTAGVVLLSLFVQGLSMSALLQRLGIAGGTERRTDLDRAHGHLHVVDGALAEIGHMERTQRTPADVLAALRQRYDTRRADAQRTIQTAHVEQADLRRETTARAVRHLLALERTSLTDAVDSGTLPSEVARELIAEVDSRMARLDSREFADPADLLSLDSHHAPPAPATGPLENTDDSH